MTSYGSITNSYNVNYMGMPNTTTKNTPFAIRTPPGNLYSTYKALGCGIPSTDKKIRTFTRARGVREGFDWTQYIDNPELQKWFENRPDYGNYQEKVADWKAMELQKLKEWAECKFTQGDPCAVCDEESVKKLYKSTFENPDVYDRASCILSLGTQDTPGECAWKQLNCQGFRDVVQYCPPYEENTDSDFAQQRNDLTLYQNRGPCKDNNDCKGINVCNQNTGNCGRAPTPGAT